MLIIERLKRFLRRLFGRGRSEESLASPGSGREPDSVRLHNIPSVEHTFRCIARNPSRYQQILVDLYLTEPDERWRWITTQFAPAFQSAWADVRTQHSQVQDQLPQQLKSEEDFMQGVARNWGDLLFGWTEQLYQRSRAFRQAVEQARGPAGGSLPGDANSGNSVL